MLETFRLPQSDHVQATFSFQEQVQNNLGVFGTIFSMISALHNQNFC